MIRILKRSSSQDSALPPSDSSSPAPDLPPQLDEQAPAIRGVSPSNEQGEQIRPKGRLAVLHIGPMKTGSTSIQWWLRVNRDALAEQGVAVPLHADQTNLSPLAATFGATQADDLDEADGIQALKIPREQLIADLDALGPETHTCIISGELMGQRMRRPAIARLKTALSPYFDRWVIVIYLRRQDELAVSRLSTMLRRGARARLAKPLDYARILDDWAGEFGREAIRPRLFARDQLIDGDVVADFIETAGLPAFPDKKSRGEQNPSLRPEAQSFLERLSKRKKERERGSMTALPGHAPLVVTVNRLYAGPGRLPARRTAQAFVEQVRESNERVCAEWFPGRTTLFSDDFSKYPEEETPEPTAEEQLEVAVDVVLALMGTAEPKDRRAKRREGKRNKGERAGRGKQAQAKRAKPASDD